MLKKLRTVVYQVNDITKAKEWYSKVFGIQPYFDEPFYVGFDINGAELGLHNNEPTDGRGTGSVTYWAVDDVQKSFTHLTENGAQVHETLQDTGGGVMVASVYDPFGNIFGLITIPGE